MDSPLPDLPDDLDALRAVAAAALARNADDAATIARQSLEIAKLRRQIYGPRSERTARLVEQTPGEVAGHAGALAVLLEALHLEGLEEPHHHQEEHEGEGLIR